MFMLQKQTVTIDITTDEIRVLAIVNQRLSRWASTPIDPGLVENGLIVDPPALGARINALMRASDIGGRNAIVGISGINSICRLLHLPYIAEQSIEDIALDVVNESMSIPVEEFYISRQIVNSDDTGQLVLVIAMLRDQVDAHVQAIKAAGIKPRILNLRSIALMRLIDKPEAYIASVEPNSLDIALIINGIPQVIRTIAPTPNTSQDVWIWQVIAALEQTVRFYASQHPDYSFPTALPLFLTGPLADNVELVQMIQDNPLYSLLPLSVPLEYSEYLPLCHYAVNIGLAITKLSLPAGMTEIGEIESIAEEMEESDQAFA